MSILSMRVKQCARVLVAGVVRSAAAFAILPGVAEAKGGGLDGEHNGNQTQASVGTATAQNGADVKGNSLNTSPQASVLDSSNNANTKQNSGGGSSGAGGGGSGDG